jgi:hypothetical protein
MTIRTRFHIPGSGLALSLRLRLTWWQLRGYQFIRLKHYETARRTPVSAAYYRRASGKEKCLVVHTWLHEVQME